VAPEVHFRFPGYYSRIYLMYSQELYKVLRRASSTHSKNELQYVSYLIVHISKGEGEETFKNNISELYCTLPEVFPCILPNILDPGPGGFLFSQIYADS
jgi:hypothetical protein